MIQRILYSCIGIAFLVLLCGCSAPHDNPLDPKSEFFHPQADTTHPTFSVRVRSEHISQIFPTQDNYTVIPELVAAGQPAIDSVWVRYLSGTWYRMSLRDGVWGVRLPSYNFNDQTLGSVIGQPFTFSVRDDSGNTYSCGPAYLFRVIESVPQVISPSSFDTVNALPLLRWQAFSANFPFYYQVNISNYSTVVWSSDRIAATELSFQVTDTLPLGDLYWTLSVVDSFADSSRSKEGKFYLRALSQ